MDRAWIAGPLVAFASICATASVTESTHAQQGAPPPAPPAATDATADKATTPAGANTQPYFATVTADDVYVRSGPSVQSSYPFGKLDRGEVVRAVEESFGWVRVQTAGRAFDDINGFVTADDRVSLSTDGASITATALTELRAPNIGAQATPDSSWKQIGRVEAGATLTVLGRVDGERASVWRVKLTPDGEGWINANFLRKATSEEAAQFEVAAADASDASIASEGIAVVVEGETEAAAAADATTATEPAKPALTPAQIAQQARIATFADLEATWLKVKGQPLADAELGALYSAFLVLASDPECEASMKRRAQSRVEQLVLQQDVQSKLIELRDAKARLNGECDQIDAVAKAIEARSEYTAVGVLNASIVYDGSNLPLLFRLQDPSSGQTVAYVVPGDGFQLTSMLGTLIGIKGEKAFDNALKLDTITPKTIDFLTPRKDG